MYSVQGRRRVTLELPRPGRVFVAVGIAWLALDQVTKVIVRSVMYPGQSVKNIIPHVIDLTFVRNSGAAFGLFPGQRPVFLLTSLLVLFVIAAYWRRARPRQWPVVVAFALVAGGSIGNLIDRAIVGYVTDFFEFAFVEFPVFNFADIGLITGVAVLMVWILFGPEPESVATQPSAPAMGADEASASGESTSDEHQRL